MFQEMQVGVGGGSGGYPFLEPSYYYGGLYEVKQIASNKATGLALAYASVVIVNVTDLGYTQVVASAPSGYVYPMEVWYKDGTSKKINTGGSGTVTQALTSDITYILAFAGTSSSSTTTLTLTFS